MAWKKFDDPVFGPASNLAVVHEIILGGVDPKNGGNTIWREKTLKYLDAAQLKDLSDQFVLDQCISRIRYYNGQIRKLNGGGGSRAMSSQTTCQNCC